MNYQRASVPGTGLPLPAFVAVLALSTALFLVYHGLLWHAPTEASHVGRFAVSYLAVIPAAGAMLLLLRRFTVSHLIGATGTLWAIKMVLTWGLYEVLAPGTASMLTPQLPHEHAAQPAGYQAASGAQSSLSKGTIEGLVKLDGVPAFGAVVMLDTPPPGRGAPPSARVELALSAKSYLPLLTLAFVDDEIRVKSDDERTHTLHVQGGSNPPANRALTKGSEVTLRLEQAGIYTARCDNHAGELGFFVVAEHPYATRSDAQGRFVLRDVPAGVLTVIALAPRPDSAPASLGRASAHLDVAPDRTTEIVLSIGSTGTPVERP